MKKITSILAAVVFSILLVNLAKAELNITFVSPANGSNINNPPVVHIPLNVTTDADTESCTYQVCGFGEGCGGTSYPLDNTSLRQWNMEINNWDDFHGKWINGFVMIGVSCTSVTSDPGSNTTEFTYDVSEWSCGSCDECQSLILSMQSGDKLIITEDLYLYGNESQDPYNCLFPNYQSSSDFRVLQDVVYDCQGHNVNKSIEYSGDSARGFSAAYYDSNFHLQNFTLRNCVIQGFNSAGDYGVAIGGHDVNDTGGYYTDGLTLENLTVMENYVGIQIRDGMNRTTLKDSWLWNPANLDLNYGCTKVDPPGWQNCANILPQNTLIYNNYFYVTPQLTYPAYLNSWDWTASFNITRTEGRNIMGGPYLGGNFWSDTSSCHFDTGMGFWINYDINGTGICDYQPQSQIFAHGDDVYIDVDSLQLTLAPKLLVNIISPQNITYTTSSVSLAVEALVNVTNDTGDFNFFSTNDVYNWTHDGITFTPNTTLTGLANGLHHINVCVDSDYVCGDVWFTVNSETPIPIPFTWRNTILYSLVAVPMTALLIFFIMNNLIGEGYVTKRESINDKMKGIVYGVVVVIVILMLFAALMA
jgi:hypothetical protein